MFLFFKEQDDDSQVQQAHHLANINTQSQKVDESNSSLPLKKRNLDNTVSIEG